MVGPRFMLMAATAVAAPRCRTLAVSYLPAAPMAMGSARIAKTICSVRLGRDPPPGIGHDRVGRKNASHFIRQSPLAKALEPLANSSVTLKEEFLLDA
jgi:hypothetical protein